MILEHTTHAGYIRQDDVYTDPNGVNYTVYQDTDADDPRSWLTHEEAALIVINDDRNTRTDDINDYNDNPVINDLLQVMEKHDIDDPSGISSEWLEGWIHNTKPDHPSYDIEMMTVHTSQSSWFTVIAAVKEGYGSARSHIDTFAAWARGDVWVVSPDHPDYDTLCGIYADDPESAAKHYIENYIPYEPPQLETLF
jgi:hypothetical protein